MRDLDRYLFDLATTWRTSDKSDLNPPGMNAPNSVMEEPKVRDLTQRQYSIYEFMRSLVDVYSKFDQTQGPDNARYMDATVNPFAAQHMTCSTCVFYTGGGCDLVNGNIQAGGLCQYALIPEDAVIEDAQTDAPGSPASGTRKAGSVRGSNPFPAEDAEPPSYY